MVKRKDLNATGAAGPDLLGRLVDRHAAALELYARQLCQSPEDVVQEAFVRLASQGEAPADPVAWLYRVVRNKAISTARSARRRKRHETVAAGGKARWFTSSAADALDARSAAAALKKLSQAEREVVVAHVWGGRTFDQIGRLMGTSDSTAHRRYEAALSALREELGVSCPERE
jgi:RNA polymerase sigma-70 factor (ECF subfamily)